MFLIHRADIQGLENHRGFNPLNQVYVFNSVPQLFNYICLHGFNPLNQVYVFNFVGNPEQVKISNEF